MHAILRQTPALLVVLAGTHAATATDRIFNDITAKSPSGQYRVEARSPDNAARTGRKAFQSGFVYRATDADGTLLWTRNQAMTQRTRGSGKAAPLFQDWGEPSPVALHVSDSGWTVIRTAWDDLIAVDKRGHDQGRLNLLTNALTEAERKAYVQDTTAGPQWSAYSVWYFLDEAPSPVFVVRPWWGRRVFMDLASGRVVAETPPLAALALRHEGDDVMKTLARGVKTRRDWEHQESCCDAVWPILEAAYLAGRLELARAIPLLEALQDSPYGGSSTMGGMGFGERFEGQVNPHSYRTLQLRQVVHLSLRRLGRLPGPWPSTVFDVEYDDYARRHPYQAKAAPGPRHTHAREVKQGMTAEQVLDLIGAPDFCGYAAWEYDLDTTPPSSLTITWDVRHVTGVKTIKPALWQQGFSRDEQLVR